MGSTIYSVTVSRPTSFETKTGLWRGGEGGGEAWSKEWVVVGTQMGFDSLLEATEIYDMVVAGVFVCDTCL